MTTAARYLLVSPCRNEAAFARRTIESIRAQTLPPAHWVIVDDGSTDETPEILAEAVASFGTGAVSIVRRDDRGHRSVGPGVIDAFYAGYETVDPARFDFVGKLDLDLELPPRYFETLVNRMAADPRLGTCSGKPYFRRKGRLVSERCGDETSVGMTKFYRTECFRQIGGFVPHVMWDGIDCHRCRMLGWIARSWDEPDLRFVHLRPMGSSDRGWWRGRVRHGSGQHFMGTSLAYMTASAAYRMTRPPLVIGGLAMWLGYAAAMGKRADRYEDPEFREFLRTYQWDCLVSGKRRATARLDARQASAWALDRDVIAASV